MGYSNRNEFWLGTEQRASFFRTPLRNADNSPQSFSDGGTLINGGGWQRDSWGSHKLYQYEWGPSSPYTDAQKLKSYADGTYGRGLIYFHDPLTYDKNVLPARWADPGMALGYEGSGLVYGVEPTATPTVGGVANNYPVTSAVYDLTNITPGWRGREDALFIPIPEGYSLFLGGAYSYTGTGGVFYRTSNAGVLGSISRLAPITPDGPVASLQVDSSATVSGIWLYVGKETTGAASVTLTGLLARLIKTSKIVYTGLGYGLDPYGETPYGAYSAATQKIIAGPWTGGMGHSGCRFVGKPTFESTGPFKGGQAGFAATLREVGSFLHQ